MTSIARSDPYAPHPRRLDPSAPTYAQIMECHSAACARGDAGYLDPTTGLFTMTALYHLQRGSCCNNGCRHCPYLPLQGDDLP